MSPTTDELVKRLRDVEDRVTRLEVERKTAVAFVIVVSGLVSWFLNYMARR